MKIPKLIAPDGYNRDKHVETLRRIRCSGRDAASNFRTALHYRRIRSEDGERATDAYFDSLMEYVDGRARALMLNPTTAKANFVALAGRADGLDELVAEVNLQLLQSGRTFRGTTEGEFRAYVTSVICNTASTLVKKDAKQPDALDAELADDRPTEDVERCERLEYLKEKLRARDPIDRAIVEGRRHGTGWRELAARLGVPAGTLRSRFSRLVQELRGGWA